MLQGCAWLELRLGERDLGHTAFLIDGDGPIFSLLDPTSHELEVTADPGRAPFELGVHPRQAPWRNRPELRL